MIIFSTIGLLKKIKDKRQDTSTLTIWDSDLVHSCWGWRGQRVGEASHPGPPDRNENEVDLDAIATFLDRLVDHQVIVTVRRLTVYSQIVRPHVIGWRCLIFLLRAVSVKSRSTN